MGERKGVNKYYPPDWDPSKGGLDKYHGVHPLRERASKLHLGILVIRFEMPFNMWCGGCNNHIGMGVRYNAEKKKIGMYYTTPLWEFRMKCHLCDNYIVMHTDPKNFDYIVAEGGRRKQEQYEQEDAECAAAHEPEARKRLGTDAMYKLQYKGKDEEVVEEAEPIIDKIQIRQDVWKDDYQLNRNLRKRLREDTKNDKYNNSVLKKKMGLDVKMLPTTKQDKITSSLVRFTTQKDSLKLQKKSAVSAIFSSKASTLLTSLKDAGVTCKGATGSAGRGCSLSALVKVDSGKRRKSGESTRTRSRSLSTEEGVSPVEGWPPAEGLSPAEGVSPVEGETDSSVKEVSQIHKTNLSNSAVIEQAGREGEGREGKEEGAGREGEEEGAGREEEGALGTSLVSGYSSSSENSD